MYCKKCGTLIGGDEKFCGKCGENIIEQEMPINGKSTQGEINTALSSDEVALAKKATGCLKYGFLAFVGVVIYANFNPSPESEMTTVCNNLLIENWSSRKISVEISHKDSEFTQGSDGAATLVFYANVHVDIDPDDHTPSEDVFLLQSVNPKFGWKEWRCTAKRNEEKKFVVTSLELY